MHAILAHVLTYFGQAKNYVGLVNVINMVDNMVLHSDFRGSLGFIA